MKLVQLRRTTRTCRKCKKTIQVYEKAWRIIGYGKTRYLCKECGDAIQL